MQRVILQTYYLLIIISGFYENWDIYEFPIKLGVAPVKCPYFSKIKICLTEPPYVPCTDTYIKIEV